jgi:hypothetical protein
LERSAYSRSKDIVLSGLDRNKIRLVRLSMHTGGFHFQKLGDYLRARLDIIPNRIFTGLASSICSFGRSGLNENDKI